MLFSIYELYRRACETTKSQPGTLQQLAKKSKEELECSPLYLAYQLFWVICILLNGKKVPHGNLQVKHWRAYVHDIVQFVSSPDILQDLCRIDEGETLF